MVVGATRANESVARSRESAPKGSFQTAIRCHLATQAGTGWYFVFKISNWIGSLCLGSETEYAPNESPNTSGAHDPGLAGIA